VTKGLRGTTNFTLESMIKIARALGAELHVQLKSVKQGPELPVNLNANVIAKNGGSRPHRDESRQALVRTV